MNDWPCGFWRGATTTVSNYPTIAQDTLHFLPEGRIEYRAATPSGRHMRLRYRAVGENGIYTVTPISDSGRDFRDQGWAGVTVRFSKLDESTLAVDGNGQRWVFRREPEPEGTSA